MHETSMQCCQVISHRATFFHRLRKARREISSERSYKQFCKVRSSARNRATFIHRLKARRKISRAKNEKEASTVVP